MAIVINARPNTPTLWNAVNNPIIWDAQRKDFPTAVIFNSGARIQVNIAGDHTAEINIDDTIYLKSDNGVYNLNVTVFSRVYSAPNTEIVFNEAYISTTTNGFINLFNRINYKLNVEVWNVLTAVKIGGLAYSPNNVGRMYVDVSPILQPVLGPETLSTTFTAPPQDASAECSVQFNIKYYETWIGGGGSVINDGVDVKALFASRQVPSDTGGQMQNLTNKGYVVVGAGLPKFLTIGNRLRAWRGYPFSVCILSQFNDADVQIHITGYNNAGTQITQYISAGASFGTKLHRFAPLTLLPTLVGVHYILMYVRKSTGPLTISETLRIDLKDPDCTAVYLYWKNSLGGDTYFLFETNQERQFFSNKYRAKRENVFAESLTLDQWASLSELVPVTPVYDVPLIKFDSSTFRTHTNINKAVYKVETDGSFIGVVVLPSSNRVNSRAFTANMEFQIEYPKEF